VIGLAAAFLVIIRPRANHGAQMLRMTATGAESARPGSMHCRVRCTTAFGMMLAWQKGMVSDRDLRTLIDPMFALAPASGTRSQDLDQPISALMSSDVISVSPESEVEEVIDLMIEHRIGAVPVTEPGSSKLQGIISYVDVMRAARDVL
jgi:hypothetical protein